MHTMKQVTRRNFIMTVVYLHLIISLVLVNGFKKKPFNFGLNQQQQQQQQRPTGLMNPFRPQRPVPMMMSECCACSPCCACPDDAGGQGNYANSGGGGGNGQSYGNNNNNNNNNNKYSEQSQSGSSDDIQIWVETGNQGNMMRPPFNFYNNWRPMKAQMVDISPNTGQSGRPNRPHRRQMDDSTSIVDSSDTGSDVGQ